MTKRERVMAALRGAPVDRVPVSLWLHNFATENSPDTLAAETLRLARTFDWDYLKPQSRAQCFAEMWGLAYRPSTERATPYTVTRHPARSAADLSRLTPVDHGAGALGEQLEALRAIRKALGADTPIVWTVFSPMMVVPFLLEGGRDQALQIGRSDPAALEAALDAIAQTLTAYVKACVDAGADGLFYATNLATRDLLRPEECRRFQRPYDRRVLDAAASAPFNIMHVCGAGAHGGSRLPSRVLTPILPPRTWAPSQRRASSEGTAMTRQGWSPARRDVLRLALGAGLGFCAAGRVDAQDAGAPRARPQPNDR